MILAELIEGLTRPDRRAVAVRRPVLLAAGGTFLALAAWTAGTAWYFLFQDDIAAHLIARQSAIEQAYEERLGSLRVHLDRLASQNLLDNEGLNKRAADLLTRALQLEARQAIVERLSRGSLETGSLRQEASPSASAAATPAAANFRPEGRPDPVPEPAKPRPVPDSFGLRRGSDSPGASPDRPQDASKGRTGQISGRLQHIQQVLGSIESAQIQTLSNLLNAAESRLTGLREAVREVGLNPDSFEAPADRRGMGGPLVPLASGSHAGVFEALVGRLEVSAGRLEQLGRAAGALPFARPIPADAELTSGFGHRIDPFTRAPAMHTGLDFRVEHGAPVHAAGAGQVIAAEHAGGYGNMVEIDHGNGVTTRYAHLALLSVSPGQVVMVGEVIGRAGSSGRSTGAHLHYETRIYDEPIDPQRFLRASARLAFTQDVER